MMKLLDVLIDRALSSSKAFSTLVEEMILLSEEIRKMKEAINTIAKVVQFQQTTLGDLIDESGKKTPVIENLTANLYGQNDKKEKPN